jgi:hypothetical protein
MRTTLIVMCCLCSFLLNSQFLFSQTWGTLESSPSFYVRSLFVDNDNDLLHVVGQFQYVNDTVETNGYANWDGNQWIIPEMFANNCDFGACSAIYSIEKLNNNVFISGAFNYTTGSHFMKYNTDEGWSHAGVPNQSGVISKANEQIFACGHFTEIDGVPMNRLAVWNGANWEPFGDELSIENGSTQDVNYYNGEYYVSGNFHTGSQAYNEIVRWDGNNWMPLQNGLFGDTQINDAVVFNNILYICGNFSSAFGNASDFVMAWNGEFWFNPFPGVQYSAIARDLSVINNELFIVGKFHFENETCCTYYLAKFDGVEFCAFGGYSSQVTSLTRIEGMHNKLYVVGNFLHGESIPYLISFPISIADDACITVNSTSTIDFKAIKSSLLTHPNPATQTVYLSSPDLTPGSFVRVYNLNGQLVYEQNLTEQSERLAIATANIGPPGMYAVQLFSPGKTVITQKLVIGSY